MRWLQRLPNSSPARCRALFATHTGYSDITPTQYELAFVWLRETGLLADLHHPVPPERRIFSAAVARSSATWFADADILIREPEELPEDALRAAEELGLSPVEAHGEITIAWGKVDQEQRQRVGSAGELALLNLLTKSISARVDHVAAVSDGYGYDLAVHTHPSPVHLEVKSTVRRGRLTIHLSRHEYNTMLRDAGWHLVAVRLTPELNPASIATVPNDWIAAHAPADRSPSGRWESCQLEVPPNVLRPGISPLSDELPHNCPVSLIGAIRWPG